MSRRRHQAKASQAPSRSSARADADHRVEGEVQQGLGRRPFVDRDLPRPVDLVSALKPTRNESRSGIAIPPLTPSLVQMPPTYSVWSGAGLLDALHAGELGRLVVGDFARRGVADEELDRRGDAGDRQRDQQAEPVQAVAPPLQHPDRVDRGDEEAGHHVGGEDHVRDLVARRRVEEDLSGLDVDDLAGGVEGEALRLVHPGVGGDHGEGAADAGDHHRHPGPAVGPAAEPLPAVDVDRDEDRLGEEEDPLDREGDAEGVAEAVHELRPEQAHLEGEHRAGDGADGEDDRHRLRPAPGQLHRVLVAVLQPHVVGDQHHRRQGDAQAGEDDVEAQRERHLLARGEQVRRRRCQRERVERACGRPLPAAGACGNGGSARWSSCRGGASAPRRPAARG